MNIDQEERAIRFLLVGILLTCVFAGFLGLFAKLCIAARTVTDENCITVTCEGSDD